MKKRLLFWVVIVLFFLLVFLIIYPNVEFYRDDYLYMLSYGKYPENSIDMQELEQEFCYSESYSYNKERDISIINWEYNNILFFGWFKVKFEKENICAKEYLLEEVYINNFLNNANIISNEDIINLNELIKGKKAIVGNVRYSWNEDNSYIEYELDGKYMEMFIYKNEEDLIIIQVGLSDEGPKYIAYE